jgi:hypothetical protein
MKNVKLITYFATCLIIQGFTIFTIILSAKAEETEKVTLESGQNYEVKLEKGMPIPFKSNEINITRLGPLFTNSPGQSEWNLMAQLHEEGNFVVTITTPIDNSISTTFECVGPGEIFQNFFKIGEYPTIWEWYREPGTSWIPFVFNFKEKQSGKEFELTQWTKFGPQVKITIRQALKQLQEPEFTQTPSEWDQIATSLGTPVNAWQTKSKSGSRFAVEYLPEGQNLQTWTRMVTLMFAVIPGHPPQTNKFIEHAAEQLRHDFLASGAEIPRWNLVKRRTDGASTLYGEFRIGTGATREDSVFVFVPVKPDLAVRITLAVRGSELRTEDRVKVAELALRPLGRSR